MRQYFLILCSLLLCSAPKTAEAQGPASHWFFGHQAGLHFQNGGAHPQFSGALSTLEGCAVSTDDAGNLQFYTNGVTIWDKSHHQMLNGMNLAGHQSASQSVTIVPRPNHPQQYWVFTAGDESGTGAIHYSEVNMSLNLGLGAVNKKNTFLISGMTERLTTIPHKNGTDYWVLTHKFNSNEFYAFRVNENGVYTTPVVSAIGTVDSSGQGYLKASLAGDRICMAYRSLDLYELYRFDRETGIVSFPITLPDLFYLSYGVEFSPDGSKLYLHSSRKEPSATSPGHPCRLFQVDLNAGSQSAIVNSITPIANIGVQYGGAFQLAPDGKIYVARPGALFLGIIQAPNAAGAACNYQDEGIYLGGKKSQFGLPNFPSSQILPHPYFTHEGTCETDSLVVAFHNTTAIDSIHWDFGEPASGIYNHAFGTKAVHRFLKSGTYKVSAVYFRGTYTDTLYEEITMLPQPVVDLGNDTSLCPSQVLTLHAHHPSTTTVSTSFLWNNQSQEPFLSTELPGIYWVEANNICGVARDTLIFSQLVPPTVDLGVDTTICENQHLWVDVTQTGTSYQWNDGWDRPARWLCAGETYWIAVENRCGVARDTLEIHAVKAPMVDLGPDRTLCEGDEIALQALPNGGSSANTILWQDGSIGPLYLVQGPGVYIVQVESSFCTQKDTVLISYLAKPEIELGEDTTLCEGDLLVLYAHTDEATYLWQDGSMNPSYLVRESGRYAVTVSHFCGEIEDAIEVTYLKAPQVNLGRDTVICNLQPFLLDVSQSTPGSSFRWHDGINQPSRLVKAAGYYMIAVENECGIARDTLEVRTKPSLCECTLDIPNVFTPNDDGVNDHFAIDYPCYLSDYDLAIYDRWGKLLFKSGDPASTWDGTKSGKSCPSGIYYYVLSYRFSESYTQSVHRQLKGSLTLLR